MKVVGVFGISGVGKTTLVERVVAGRVGWARVSAGSFVQDIRPGLTRDALRASAGEEFHENQMAIVEGLHRLRAGLNVEVLLFDGHLVIDNGWDLVEVPLDVVRRLELSAVVFIEDVPETIVERRAADGGRERAERSEEHIANEQSTSRRVASSYAYALAVPFASFMPTEHLEVVAFVKGLW